MLECSLAEQCGVINMQMKCRRCQSKATIGSRQNISDTSFRLYCYCTNGLCNRSWPILCHDLEDIRPSDLGDVDKVRQLLYGLSEEDRKSLLNEELKKAG